MAYSTGSVILDDDYNIFATGNASGTGDNNVANVNTVWGIGNNDKGYGQTTLPVLSAVTAGQTVTATQWSTMLARISSAATHQSTTITPISSPVAGNTISAYAALSTNITSIYNNRLNCVSSGTSITSGGSVNRTVSWGTSVTFTQTITFASGDTARYFFNAGGRVTLSYSRTGGSVNSQNTAITDLCTAVGTITLTGGSGTATIAGGSFTGTNKTGGSGSPTIASTTGYYDLTTANVQVFTQSSSSYYGYEGNSLTINVKSNGTQGSNADAGSVLTVYTTIAKPGGLTTVDGTLNATMTLLPSESTNLTTVSWGTPAMSGSETGS
jgi:hypothetical protein